MGLLAVKGRILYLIIIFKNHCTRNSVGEYVREILQEHSSWLEGDVNVLLGGVGPVQNLVNVGFFDGELVTVSHSALKEHSDGVGQPIDSVVLEGWQLVVVVGLGVVVEGGLNTIEWIFLGSCGHGSGGSLAEY
jgi:hypothetical protein